MAGLVAPAVTTADITEDPAAPDLAAVTTDPRWAVGCIIGPQWEVGCGIVPLAGADAAAVCSLSSA